MYFAPLVHGVFGVLPMAKTRTELKDCQFVTVALLEGYHKINGDRLDLGSSHGWALKPPPGPRKDESIPASS